MGQSSPSWCLRVAIAAALVPFTLPSCFTANVWRQPPRPHGEGYAGSSQVRVAIGPSRSDAALFVPRKAGGWTRVRIREHLPTFHAIAECARKSVEAAAANDGKRIEDPRWFECRVCRIDEPDGSKTRLLEIELAWDWTGPKPTGEGPYDTLFSMRGVAQRDRYFGMRSGPFTFYAACEIDVVAAPPSVSTPWPASIAFGTAVRAPGLSVGEKLAMTPLTLGIDAVLLPFEVLAIGEWW